MSCNCKNTEGVVATLPCACDELVHPLPLNIGAGLSHLPRQIAHFPEFRRAMLASVKEHGALVDWRARKEDDLGVMLLEMWAYICDSLSFYDEVLADEAYLRTAQLRPSLRRMIALIGYRPSPAVAATVSLAAFAEGRIPVRLPSGTSFRSGAFDDNPPQVFELDNDTWIHPLTNKWAVKPPLAAVDNKMPLISPQTEVKRGSVFLLLHKDKITANQGLTVNYSEKTTGKNGEPYAKWVLNAPITLADGIELSDMRLLKPTQSVGLWTLDNGALTANSTDLILKNSVPNINIGDDILVTFQKAVQWFRVTAVADSMVKNELTTDSVTVNGSIFNLPKISTPVTKITLDKPLNWGSPNRSAITVHYEMQETGQIIQEPETMLSKTNILVFDGLVEKPVDKISADTFFLQDKNTRGVLVTGLPLFEEGKLNITKNESWESPLTLPVDIFGNVVQTSRGERVENEVMGSGNASAPNQTFKLKKKPLTYLLNPTAANEQGTLNTLKIRVNGILWREVASFYGRKPYEQVYIVRQDDEHDTFVTFGDGIRGERLPSGSDNIVAFYRFGAGRASPPAGSISQIGKPVKGLQSVKNPVAASGGADAETAEGMRQFAPKSALILGRVVSIQDMEAVAATFPGVRAVQTIWEWDVEQQRAVVKIWYVGEVGIESKLMARLKAIKDPTTPVVVQRATAVPIRLTLDIQIDPRFDEATVLEAVRQKLLNIHNGDLIPEQLGIGKSLFRSQIFAHVLAVDGTQAINNIFLDDASFSDFAKPSKSGHYFDFETNGIRLNQKPPLFTKLFTNVMTIQTSILRGSQTII